jgi:hypothetical protein
MLLAAEGGDKLALLTPEKDLPAGTQISSDMEPGQKQISFKEFQKLDIRAGVVAQADPPVLDLGSRKMQCTVDSPEVGKKYAAFIAGDKAMVMHGPNKVKIVFDVDIQAGAKIR